MDHRCTHLCSPQGSTALATAPEKGRVGVSNLREMLVLKCAMLCSIFLNNQAFPDAPQVPAL